MQKEILGFSVINKAREELLDQYGAYIILVDDRIR